VKGHYGTADLRVRIREALQQAGLDKGTVDWSKLAPLDQFHVRGLDATKEFAKGIGIEPHSAILDVGCGLGGPARFLAATYGCHVTGIDLSQPFVDAAQMLSDRADLSSRLTFQQANALDLPFADA